MLDSGSSLQPEISTGEFILKKDNFKKRPDKKEFAWNKSKKKNQLTEEEFVIHHEKKQKKFGTIPERYLSPDGNSKFEKIQKPFERISRNYSEAKYMDTLKEELRSEMKTKPVTEPEEPKPSIPEKLPHPTKLKLGPGSVPGPFTALCYKPDRVAFREQDEGEQIVLLVRRHFGTNIPWILQTVLLAIIPIFILPYLSFLLPVLHVSGTTKTAYILFYYLVIFGFVLIKFTSWYFNVGLVTTSRLIDADTDGILYRHVSETKLGMIEDVSYTQAGAIASFFDYGDVLVQTAGEKDEFIFDRVPKPSEVRSIIAELIPKHE